MLYEVITINILKLRASYGSVGNEGIQPYQSLSTLVPRDYIINGSKTGGLLPGASLPNPDLSWRIALLNHPRHYPELP